VQIQGRTL